MTLDGVVQTEESDGDGFKHGGWFFPYADEVTGAAVQERLAKPVDLLLGRKTLAGWETYWPTNSNFWPNVMTATKYFKVTSGQVAPKGIIIATYERDGDVKTGSPQIKEDD
jgi:hypothetical protein